MCLERGCCIWRSVMVRFVLNMGYAWSKREEVKIEREVELDVGEFFVELR